MEPQDHESDNDGDPDRVEFTVVTDAGTFAAISPRLDLLIREYDLESHVKRG